MIMMLRRFILIKKLRGIGACECLHANFSLVYLS